jgi:predicted nucleotidyltransferase
MNPYGKIFKALNDAEVRYIIVGGVAMNLLGYPRFTGDIDVLMALDGANLAKMASLMERMGYERRLPVGIEVLGDEEQVLRWIREKGLLAYTFINAREPQFSIDVIVGPSLKFADYQRHRTLVTVWDIAVPVVSIDDLIGMKRESSREKDAEDVAALLELKGL